MKLRALIAVIALALPAAARAQQPGGPPQGPPAGGMREGRMLQNTIEWLLTQKDQFRPSGEQVAQLEAAAKVLNDSIAKGREDIRKVREESMSQDGDRRAAFEKMRPLMDQIRKQDEKATTEALKILNSEQQKVVQELLEQRRKEQEMRRRQFSGSN